MLNNAKDTYDIDSIIVKETIDKIDRPEKFAELFCEVAKTQTMVKCCLSEIVKDVIENDKNTEKVLKQQFENIIKEDNKIFWKSVWVRLAFIGNLIIGSAITLITQWISKKF